MVAFRTIKSVLNPVLAAESSQRQYVEEQSWLDLAHGPLEFADF